MSWTAGRTPIELRSTRLLEGPGLQLPWQTDPKRDAFDNLSVQVRNDITDEAQVNEIERSEVKNEEWLFSFVLRSAYV